MKHWEDEGDLGCPKCGEMMACERCSDCEDGVWEDEDCNGVEYYPCDNCLGTGYYEWCKECGWDNVFKCFL